MTIKQCYEAMGADYENVSQRIPSEAMIKKFATKFPEDESFTRLTDALKNGNAEIAFRAVHTMKGQSPMDGTEEREVCPCVPVRR